MAEAVKHLQTKNIKEGLQLDNIHAMFGAIGIIMRIETCSKAVQNQTFGTGYLGIWVFGYLGIWVFGHLGIWVFGHLGIWVFGHSVIWAFGHSAFGRSTIRAKE
jgi:hypothetical protein